MTNRKLVFFQIKGKFNIKIRGRFNIKKSKNLSCYCSKEDFDRSLNSKGNKINSFIELLKYFDFNSAIENNNSFKYFIEKLKLV
ncbi:MAG: hypothetical protein LBT66_01435 [Methanobrevibacter sp.]|jgi:hypothetical protein|nr:hypothetical protein [Candidatus Methanovirga meridionalis]